MRNTVAELSAPGWQVEAFEFDQGDWPSHERLIEVLPGPVDVLATDAAQAGTAQRES